MKTSHWNLFTDTFCKVCRAVLQFESQRASHYKVVQTLRLMFCFLHANPVEDNRHSCEVT
uniref:Uncharacterized protein n=1 Tax=Buteo japonicus TaxID=224669 RepID=A0A8C0AQH2_9AVES